MKNRGLLAGLPILILLLCVSVLAAHAKEVNQTCSPGDADFKRIVKRVNGYLLQIERLKTDSQEEEYYCRASVISPSGKVVFQEDSAPVPVAIHIRELITLHQITGKDLNGDGQPEAVFEYFSGGAHCCWTYWIVSLGSPPGLIRHIDNELDLRFQDIDKDGRIEISTGDGNFDYFDCLSHAGTPFPTVILRLEGRLLKDVGHEFKDRYDSEIVQARAELRPSEVARFRAAGDVCAYEPGDTMPTVLTIVFGYLYSGREQAAWQALEKMWPSHDVARIRKKIIETRAGGILHGINASVEPARGSQR